MSSVKSFCTPKSQARSSQKVWHVFSLIATDLDKSVQSLFSSAAGAQAVDHRTKRHQNPGIASLVLKITLEK